MKTITQRGNEQYGLDRSESFYTLAPPLPRNMMVELTNACNHKCIFCANPHMTRRAARIDAGLLHRVMAEARVEGVEEIGFYTTGDPFVHRDLARFTRHARDLGYRYIYISTNGALATPARAKAVIDAGMNSIKFSINAGSRETYRLVHGRDEWDKVLAHLRYISEYRRTLGRPLALFVTCVVTNPVRGEIDAFRRLVEPLVDEVSVNECGIQSGQMTAAQALLSAGESRPRAEAGVCTLPFNRLHVTCEGYLTLCCVDYQNYLTVADLKELSVRDAWYSDAFRDARRRHVERDLAGTLCGNCWLARTDPIAPLNAAHATVIDFPEFYGRTADRTRRRLTRS